MNDFITLTCPTCGGKLEITKDVERFACTHCGTEHVVNRGSGIVFIRSAVEGLAGGLNKTATELTIMRLMTERAEARTEVESLEVELAEYQGKLTNLKETKKAAANQALATAKQNIDEVTTGAIQFTLLGVIAFVIAHFASGPWLVKLIALLVIGFSGLVLMLSARDRTEQLEVHASALRALERSPEVRMLEQQIQCNQVKLTDLRKSIEDTSHELRQNQKTLKGM